VVIETDPVVAIADTFWQWAGPAVDLSTWSHASSEFGVLDILAHSLQQEVRTFERIT